MSDRYRPVPLLGPAFPPTAPDVRFRRRITPPAHPDPAAADRPPAGAADYQIVQGLRAADRMAALPPWLYPPFNARGVLLPLNFIPAVLAAGGTTFVTWPAIPNGKTGVVAAIGLSTTDFSITRLTTMLNRNPVDPYAGIIGNVGALAEPQPLPSPVIVPAGAVFEVQIENTGAVAITVAVVTKGWWY